MERQIETLDDLSAEAGRFMHTLVSQEHGATLVTLSGALGAGKTAFTKALARSLGVEEMVNSPTFVLEKIYLLPEGKPFRRLVHIDAYRLGSGAELAPLGFDELMQDADNLILLEWPEKVVDALPDPAIRISLVVHEDNTRAITYA